jgi:hypothetical protein
MRKPVGLVRKRPEIPVLPPFLCRLSAILEREQLTGGSMGGVQMHGWVPDWQLMLAWMVVTAIGWMIYFWPIASLLEAFAD